MRRLLCGALGLCALAAPPPAPAQQGFLCVPATERDRAVIEVVSREVAAAWAGRASDAQVRQRVSASLAELRGRGALACAGDAAESPDPPRQGALAVGPGGAWGASWDHRTPQSAAGTALRECGRNCRVVVRIVGPSCGAFAAGGSGYGWGTAPTRAEAEQRALAECGQRGRGCTVRVWGCNTRP